MLAFRQYTPGRRGPGMWVIEVFGVSALGTWAYTEYAVRGGVYRGIGCVLALDDAAEVIAGEVADPAVCECGDADARHLIVAEGIGSYDEAVAYVYAATWQWLEARITSEALERWLDARLPEGVRAISECAPAEARQWITARIPELVSDFADRLQRTPGDARAAGRTPPPSRKT